jgi:hypothetical protein
MTTSVWPHIVVVVVDVVVPVVLVDVVVGLIH